MPRTAIFDARGNILPITMGDLAVPPRPSYVEDYANRYTCSMVREAKGGNAEFELFLELHRRASTYFLKHGSFLGWNKGEGSSWDHHSNARIIGEYDLKWGVTRRSGRTYLPEVEGSEEGTK